MPNEQGAVVEPIDEALDHLRGPEGAPLILEYGDYECPYSRQAFRAIKRLEARREGGVRFVFRHFPLTRIHPHALVASLAAEAAASQKMFWEMHEMLFHHQRALEDHDLLEYAIELGLEVWPFEHDRASQPVLERVQRDVDGGVASGQVHGTPTLFINGVLHEGGYDVASLMEAIGG